MIYGIFDEDIRPTASLGGRKILAYFNAYGTKYDFCRFFASDKGGYALVYNGVITLDGDFDREELEGFISIANPYAVEMSSNIALHIGDNYRRYEVKLYGYSGGREMYNLLDVRINKDYAEVYRILGESFGMSDFPAWYTDLSHKVRHGVSNMYLYKTTTATSYFEAEDTVFLSHIATAIPDRGKGRAGELVRYLCGKYSCSGKKIYLCCTDERKTFYEMLGFTYVKDEFVYRKELIES